MPIFPCQLTENSGFKSRCSHGLTWPFSGCISRNSYHTKASPCPLQGPRGWRPGQTLPPQGEVPQLPPALRETAQRQESELTG